MSDFARSRLELARHFAAIGQPQRVLEALDGAEVLGEPESWWLRGDALYQLDRCDEGADAARRGLELDPDDLQLQDVLALNLIELGDLQEAERALLAALSVAPDHPALLCHYALACARGGEREKARRLVDRAARLQPESVDVLRTRAQVAYLNGDNRKTKQYAEELLTIEPEDRVGRILLGSAHAERNVYAAVRHHEEAVRLDPGDRELANVLRHNRTLTHWLQWPIYPIQRFGAIKVWGAYLAALAITVMLQMPYLAITLVILYFVMVVYSWTVAPLSRWLMQRKIR